MIKYKTKKLIWEIVMKAKIHFKKHKLKTLSIGLFAFICSYGTFLGNIYGEENQSSYDFPSMIADRSNEGSSLQHGSSFFAVPQNNVLKIPANKYNTPPNVRVYQNGKEKLYPMTLDTTGKNYEITLPEGLNVPDLLKTKNALQILGELKKDPALINYNSQNSNLILRDTNPQPRIIENDYKAFIGNYDYLPIVLTNLNFNPNSSNQRAIYVKYEKIDAPEYENNPDVMNTPYESRILYPSSWVQNNSVSFYIKTPYGYKTYIYGLPFPAEHKDAHLTKISKDGVIIEGPTQVGVYTTILKIPMLVLDPATGDIKVPEFLDEKFKAPTTKEVEYFTTDEENLKKKLIEAGIVYQEDNINRPNDIKILGEIPNEASDVPVDVEVQLLYKDGSSIIIKVPVIVHPPATPDPPAPPVDPDPPIDPPQPKPADKNLDPHINLLSDRYTIIFAMQDTLRKRIGDLREAKEDRGIWAKVKKSSYPLDASKLKSQYTGIQVGFDTEKILDEDTPKEKNRYTGFAFEHLKGDTNSKKIPSQNKLLGNIFTIYQTDIYKDGRYLDLVGRLGRVRDDMKFSDENATDSATWHSNYYSLSAEYGKMNEGKNNFYAEPQVQITYSHLGSSKYVSENNTFGYLDSVNSLVLRSGILLGKKDDTSHIYGKVFVNHEFLGRTTGNYTLGANNQNHNLRNRGSWITLGLGVQKHFDKQNYFYFDVERDFGKKLKKNWGINGGLRHMF